MYAAGLIMSKILDLKKGVGYFIMSAFQRKVENHSGISFLQHYSQKETKNMTELPGDLTL